MVRQCVARAVAKQRLHVDVFGFTDDLLLSIPVCLFAGLAYSGHFGKTGAGAQTAAAERYVCGSDLSSTASRDAGGRA